MNRRHLFHVCAALVAVGCTAPFSRSASIDPLLEWAKRHDLKLVGDTTDLKLSTAPASVGYRDSRVGDGTVQIQAGLKAELLSFFEAAKKLRETNVLQLGVEFHRDSTHVVKTNREKQNLFSASLVHERQWSGKAGETVPILKTSLTFKNDRVEKGQGVLGSVGVSLYSQNCRFNYANRSDSIPYSLSPLIELQVENKDGLQTTPPATTPIDGNVTRAKASLAASAWPLGGALNRRVELTARFDYWRNLARSGVFTGASFPRNQRITTASLVIWGDDGQHVGLGFEHSNGENPEKNKPRDRTNEIAIKIKF